MITAPQKSSLAKPRWDGSRVMFEIDVSGQRIPCAISRGALQDLRGQRRLASTDPLRCFLEARVRIEEIAATAFHARPEHVSGTLSIWADDIDEPQSVQAAARQPEHRARA